MPRTGGLALTALCGIHPHRDLAEDRFVPGQRGLYDSRKLRFREFLGTFMEHCHNTQHEDHSMLLRWDIIHPGSTIAVPTPEGGWEGTFWEPSYVLPSWRNGSGIVTAPAAQ